MLRAEGLTELTGDLYVNCAGGTPTSLGDTIPTIDLTVYYNTRITNRLLSSSNQSDIILTVDDPTAAQTSSAQTCTNAAGCAAVGAGPGTDFINRPNSIEFKQPFTYTAIGGVPVPGSVGAPCTPNAASGTTCPMIANPNVFPGVVSGNSVTFSGIPIDPPGTQSNRIYRITNVRVDATVPLGAGSGTPGQIVALLSTTAATSSNGVKSTVNIVNPTNLVGFVQSSLSVTVRDSANSGVLSAPVALSANSALTKVATLRFSELFATAFKRRTIPYQTNNLSDPTVAEQNTLGLVYNSETGYYNSKLGFTAGLADSGTRLKAYFSGVPAGVRLFVDAGYMSQTGLAVLTASEAGPFSAVPATNGSPAEVAVSGGTGAAIWEYFGGTNAALAVENLDFGVFALTSGTPAAATMAVNASYAPTATSSGSAGAIPRFLDTSTAVGLISTSACTFGITTPAKLANGSVGAAYGPLSLGACGGSPPYSWSAAAGSLPAGLSLSATGVLSGVPSAAGTTSFAVTLTDSGGHTASQTFSLTVIAPLAITSTTLPNGNVGANYSATLSASGGVPPYTWSVPYPPLPGGLTLSPSTGKISGIITASGYYNFQVRVTDSIGQAVTGSVFFSVGSSPGFQCLTSVDSTPTMRGEGVAELAGDILFTCYSPFGSQPTAAGAPIPTADIQITFTGAPSWDGLIPGAGVPVGTVDIPLANRPLADPWSEALLLIDQSEKGNRFPCDTQSGVCPAIGDGTGGTSYYGGGPVGTAGNNRNVYQGKRTGPNTILFSAIPIDPPPDRFGARILRITNVRLNASPATPAHPIGLPGAILAGISMVGPAIVPYPNEIVGYVQPSMSTSARNAANSSPLASPIAVEPCANPPLTKVATLRFSELFPTAFKRRIVPIPNNNPLDQTLVNQDTLGLVYNAETFMTAPSATAPA
jgi:hypothetical protein